MAAVELKYGCVSGWCVSGAEAHSVQCITIRLLVLSNLYTVKHVIQKSTHRSSSLSGLCHQSEGLAC